MKNQVVDGLSAIHQVEVPKALVEAEINVLRRQTLQQFGGGAQIDESRLPAEMFREQASRRVALGLIMGEIIKREELKPEPEKVRTLVEEIAQSYEEPEDVVKWYYSDRNNLAQVETMALEEAVVDRVLESAEVNSVETSYEEALKPTPRPAKAASEEPGERGAGAAEGEAAPDEEDSQEEK